MTKSDLWNGRRPTRQEAIEAAAEIYLEELIRIETERQKARLLETPEIDRNPEI